MCDKNEIFTEKARKVHGDRYDYCKVNYNRNSTNVIIICQEHGEFLQRPNNHLNGAGCKECAKKDRANTNLERYGHSNIAHGSKKEKILQTNLERYGAKNFWSSKEGRDVIKNTLQQKYGVDNPSLSPEIQEKRKQTFLDRIGVGNPSLSLEIQEKRKQTFLDRYNQPCSFKIPEVQSKIRQTCLDRYGVENPFQSNTILQKALQHNKDNHQGLFHGHCHLSDTLDYLNDYDWMWEQYVGQHNSMDYIANLLNTSTTTIWNYLKYHDIPRRQFNFCSSVCIKWLESIMESDNIYIQHAMNGGEYQIPGTRYKADGYCAETNTVYEFHGDIWHGNPTIYKEEDFCHPYSTCTAGELYQKTMEKEKNIKELGYNLVTIWESEFNKLLVKD